jgi:hypothetical protein
MGTNIKNLDKYLNLWEIFDEKLKDQNLNLSSFAKKWEKYNSIKEENDYKRFYEKIKSQRKRKDNLKRVQENTISQIEEYIQFLDKDFTAETIRDDETYEYWYN